MRGRQAVELEGLVGEAVLAEHQRRAAEGVGLDDVAAGREVALVDAVDHVGAGGAEVLVAPLELGAAEVVGGQGRRPGGRCRWRRRAPGRARPGPPAGARCARPRRRGAGETGRRRPDRSSSLLLPWSSGQAKSPTREHHETGFPLRTLNCRHVGRPHPRSRGARGHLGCPSQVAEPGRSRTARNAAKSIARGAGMSKGHAPGRLRAGS